MRSFCQIYQDRPSLLIGHVLPKWSEHLFWVYRFKSIAKDFEALAFFRLMTICAAAFFHIFRHIYFIRMHA